jgi:hypothetical protein
VFRPEIRRATTSTGLSLATVLPSALGHRAHANDEEETVAEIPVQPKRGARPWGWIIAIIIVAIILWLIFGHRATAPTTTGSAVPTQVAPALAATSIAPTFLA